MKQNDDADVSFLADADGDPICACAPVLISKLTGTVMLKTSPPRPPRNRVDLSTKDLTRLWCKHFGKSKAQIEAAISKVGNNAATVSKELEARPALGP